MAFQYNKYLKSKGFESPYMDDGVERVWKKGALAVVLRTKFNRKDIEISDGSGTGYSEIRIDGTKQGALFYNLKNLEEIEQFKKDLDVVIKYYEMKGT